MSLCDDDTPSQILRHSIIPILIVVFWSEVKILILYNKCNNNMGKYSDSFLSMIQTHKEYGMSGIVFLM
jgi:ethanolamine utilization protein EutP (predicted NTPase)